MDVLCTKVSLKGYPYLSPVGETKRKQYVWKADYSGLEEVGEIDIQDELDEAGRGRSTGEMVRRILQGDTSALVPGEGVYADVSDVPESGVEAATKALAPVHKLERAASSKGITIEELKALVAALDAEGEAKVPAADTPKEGE